jgi:hypothetical protein
MNSRLVAIIFSLTATLAYAEDETLPKDEPVSVVTALFKLDANGHGDAVFPRSSRAPNVDYLTPALRTAWTSAARRSAMPFFEGDPLTGLSETHGETIRDIAPAQHGMVAVTLAIPAYDGVPARTGTVEFVLTHESGRWQVDDIKYPDALADLQDLADPTAKAALAAYVGSLRATLAHAITR